MAQGGDWYQLVTFRTVSVYNSYSCIYIYFFVCKITLFFHGHLICRWRP